MSFELMDDAGADAADGAHDSILIGCDDGPLVPPSANSVSSFACFKTSPYARVSGYVCVCWCFVCVCVCVLGSSGQHSSINCFETLTAHRQNNVLKLWTRARVSSA